MNAIATTSRLPLAPWAALARPRVFGIALALTVVAALASLRQPEAGDLFGFGLIAFASLTPIFLWCTRQVEGLPIFPVFALGTLWTFGLPLLADLPAVLDYSGVERFNAALIITGTLLAGLFPWFLLTRGRPRRPLFYVALRPRLEVVGLPLCLIALIVYNIVTASFDVPMGSAVLSLTRGVLLAVGNLAVFLLGYRDGNRTLARGQARLYRVLVVLLLLSTLPSALLVSSLSSGALAFISFALGRGKIPWRAAILFFALTLFLHAGKAAVREKYWVADNGDRMALSVYPAFFRDWISASRDHFLNPADATSEPGLRGGDTPAGQTFLERASLLQLFLRIQAMSPAQVPYLEGATYSIVPQLLVPRIFNEAKARSHLGTYILSIHYGLQTAEDTLTTTIGFGLINEALANFGAFGCLGLGLLLGTGYGLVTRWSAGHPVNSLRTLLSVTVLSLAYQNEYTAGVFLSALFQDTAALLLLVPWTMARVRRL